jgi:hypothetical protein
MERFEYEISTHDGSAFAELAYVCSQQGECSQEAPQQESQILVHLMNQRGLQGWELIQLFPGDQGVIAFWKRRLVSSVIP